MPEKILMNNYEWHCNFDTPFFCHYSSHGLETHCHVDFYELCIIVSGSYEHIHNEKTTICKVGDILFFSPGQIHSLVACSTNSYHYSVIIKQDFFRDFCRKNLHNAEKILSTPSVVIKTSGVQLAYLAQIASCLTFMAGDDLMPTIKLFLSNILFACFDNLPATTANMNKIYAVDLLQRFNNFAALSEDVTTIYKQYPLSRNALINDFKKLTGCTIVQYRNMKRIEYAAHLLQEANYSVTDICDILNIENHSHFAKQFKKTYGIAPKQYQIQHRPDENNENKKRS